MKAYRKTQRDKILEHLKKYGSITELEAYDLYASLRCGARIWELRNMGYSIRTEYTTKPNRYGIRTTFATYVLED